jgi:hypothetical protein
MLVERAAGRRELPIALVHPEDTEDHQTRGVTDLTRWCPSCGAEYVPGMEECPDCEVPLTDGAPGTGFYDLVTAGEQDVPADEVSSGRWSREACVIGWAMVLVLALDVLAGAWLAFTNDLPFGYGTSRRLLPLTTLAHSVTGMLVLAAAIAARVAGSRRLIESAIAAGSVIVILAVTGFVLALLDDAPTPFAYALVGPVGALLLCGAAAYVLWHDDSVD